MANLFERVSGNQEADNSAKAKSFFSESPHYGYFTKANFLNYVGKLNEQEFIHLNKMFELTSKSYPINHLLGVETCAWCGEQEITCCFTLQNAQIDLHIVYTPEIKHFLDAYQENLDPAWRELVDLMEEAHAG